MNFKDLTQCKSPVPVLGDLAQSDHFGVSYKGVLIKKGRASKVIDLSPEDLNESELREAFFDLIKPIGIAGFSLIFQHEVLQELVNRQESFREFSIPYDEPSRELLLRLARCGPTEGFLWIDSKSLSFRELFVTHLIEDDAVFALLLEKISTLKLSRQEGAQALELFSELAAMGESLEDLLAASHDKASWLNHLRESRYPRASAQDQAQADQLSALPQHRDFQMQWRRNGDQAGVQISFHVRSLNDLEKKWAKLAPLKESLVQTVFKESP